MQTVKGVFLEPVGCLAEFSGEPFIEIASELFGRRKSSAKSGSRTYWHLLNLMEAAKGTIDSSALQGAERLERQAVETAHLYDDVLPALVEIQELGVKLALTSSLSEPTCHYFLERFGLAEHFSTVIARGKDGAVKAGPLKQALASTSLQPEEVIFLTDTLEGVKVAKAVGLNAVLMMNDPDEAMRLAEYTPAGIVSLHELPDFIRLVESQNQPRANR